MNATEEAPVERRKIKIPYKPRYWALEMHDTKARWIALVIHRRGGKTTAAYNHLQRDAMRHANTRYAYIAPTYRQAKRIVWKMAKHYAQNIPGVKFNESELLITFSNGSEIMILGAGQADSLRGIGLNGAFLDEYPQMSPVIFTEIITKCLADQLGYCIFGGTPKGKGHFYKVYETALKNPENWCLVYRTVEQSLKQEGGYTIENLRQALFDDKELVKAGMMTQDEFEQEWYNSFEASIRGAIYLHQLRKARERGRIKHVDHDETLPVYTVWDLGVGGNKEEKNKGDAMAIGFYQKINGELRMIDYYENVGLGLPHYIKFVKEKPYIYAKHFAPHDIRHKELTTGKTRLDTAAALGINFEVVPSVSVEDGIDLGRAAFNRLWVDSERCSIWLDLMGQYHYAYDEKKGMLTDKPVHDFTSHGADVHRYASVVEEYMVPDDFAVVPRAASEEGPADEFMGDLDPEWEDAREGYGKHPDMRGINIGALGHKPKQ